MPAEALPTTKTATLTFEDKTVSLPVVSGSEQETAVAASNRDSRLMVGPTRPPSSSAHPPGPDNAAGKRERDDQRRMEAAGLQSWRQRTTV